MTDISQTSRQEENVENGLDPHVWQAAADVIDERIARHRLGMAGDFPCNVSEQDEALAGWVIAELHKFGFIKDPNK